MPSFATEAKPERMARECSRSAREIYWCPLRESCFSGHRSPKLLRQQEKRQTRGRTFHLTDRGL